MILQEVINSKILNQLYDELWCAYEKGERDAIIQTVDKINCALPGISEQALEKTRQIFISHGQLMRVTHICLISDDELKWNVEGYLAAMEQLLREEQHMFFSVEAFHRLFEGAGKFESNQKLYEKGGKVLTVSGLLSVAEYGLRVFNVFGSEKATECTKDAVFALKGIRSSLQNDSNVRKPLNRQLHAMVDRLRGIVKPHLEKEPHQRVEEGVSTLIDLAIDFFCWR